MADKVLYPCECGRKIPVEPSQAGRTIRCECGKEIELPSLRGIRELEPAPVEKPSQSPRPEWGLPDQLLLTGIILIGLGTLGCGFLWYSWPIVPPEWEWDLDLIRERTQDLSLEQSMKLWENLGKEKWEREDIPYVLYYRATVESFNRWLIVLSVVIGLGVVLLISSLVAPSRSGRRRAEPENGRPAGDASA